MVFWITGLSGSGKTTIATRLHRRLAIRKQPAILLDGDALRKVLGEERTYSKADRLRLAQIYSRLCKMLSDQGFLVIIATISMFEKVRRWNRKNIRNYVEIYLKTSLEERIRRDPKRLYSSRKRSALVGFDGSFEEPRNPDMVFESKVDGLTPRRIVDAILERTFRKP